jgi:hypothetical protein
MEQYPSQEAYKSINESIKSPNCKESSDVICIDRSSGSSLSMVMELE